MTVGGRAGRRLQPDDGGASYPERADSSLGPPAGAGLRAGAVLAAAVSAGTDPGTVAAQVDGWLVQAAADRDEGAFEQLVREHTAVMYAGALRATGSVQLAQDVVQEAWLSAWLHLPGFRGHSTVRTWLVRIVATTALNALRRRRVTVPLDQVGDRVHPDDVAGQAEQHERAAAVRAAVAQLPARQREAVVLRDLEGLTYQQVADELGCTVAAVKSALHHGRAGLARTLDAHRPGGVALTFSVPAGGSTSSDVAVSGTAVPVPVSDAGSRIGGIDV